MQVIRTREEFVAAGLWKKININWKIIIV
jgi:hypothetical protein